MRNMDDFVSFYTEPNGNEHLCKHNDGELIIHIKGPVNTEGARSLCIKKYRVIPTNEGKIILHNFGIPSEYCWTLVRMEKDNILFSNSVLNDLL